MSEVRPPVAKRVHSERVHHGDVFVDEYAWLGEKEDPEVTAYLEAQNAFADAQTADLADLRSAIFGEIKARTRETDMGVPVRSEGYWYYVRTTQGHAYPRYCRCPIASDDDWTPPQVSLDETLPGEQVYFDMEAEAQGHDFYNAVVSMSHDGRRIAYGVDLEGDERYTLRIRDLDTGDDLPGEIVDTAGSAVWSIDGRFVFYLTVDDAWRPDKVWRHEVGAGVDDVLVFHEPDEHFWVGVGGTASDRYLVISSESKVTTESFILSADDPTGEFVSIAGRTPGIEYGVEHAIIGGDDYFVIVHNGDDGQGGKAVEYAVDIAPVDDIAARRPLIPHDPTRRIEEVDCFRDYLVLSYRSQAVPRVAVADLRGIDGVPTVDDFHEITFDQELSSPALGSNPEWCTPRLRLVYTSFVDPTEAVELDVATGERTLLRRQTVLGDYDPSTYVATRDWAVADDGTRVPVSLVHRRDLADGPAPVLLVGYGAYELPLDPGFSIPRLSLLDRGVVLAYAHIRGGGELGRNWYESGRLLNKRNTFTDYIAVARHLIDSGRTSASQLVADGGSAGGLLMGAVVNMAPELFGGVLAGVPFVDALTSMLDPSLPLTVTEWDEWGNPYDDPEVYEYMKSYSPYENVGPRAYPTILALASFNDTRVLYTEAAKWVAALQATTTSDAPILLKTEMSAGHGGVSGRYKQWAEIAFEHAWILRASGAV
ncbi:protease [Gordonia spumicola]|uniref:Protease n=2 Tax=Gordonia spumicola TaxID=589161 RepID=A0A7I9V835_9ACTN|nr:protease [Gordonia spumicola]